MYLFVFLLIVLLLLFGLGIFFYKRLSFDVIPTQAGNIKELGEDDDETTTTEGIKIHSKVNPLNKYYFNNKVIDPNQYHICTINGDCMIPRGINHGDKIFAKKISDAEKRQLKSGSIILLKYTEHGKDGYKLRELIDYIPENDKIQTMYYANSVNENGDSVRKIIKSRPHSIDNVLGVVEMYHPNLS